MGTITSALGTLWPWVAYALLLVAAVAGLFLNILGLPGLWLIVVAAIAYAWAFNFVYFGWWTIIALFALGVSAEIVEFFASAAGSKQAGGSKRGMAGAVVGGLVGGLVATPLIPIPILGTIIGSVAGSFIGAYGIEWWIGKTHGEAATISYGAAKGRVVGIVAKSAFGIAMAMLVAIMGVPFNWWTNAPTPVVTPTTMPAPATVPANPDDA